MTFSLKKKILTNMEPNNIELLERAENGAN